MGGMIALILMAEAAATCAPPVPTRLSGGAEAVRAILDFDAQPPEAPAPTWAAANQAPADVRGDSSAETRQPDSGPPAAQCKMVPAAFT